MIDKLLSLPELAAELEALPRYGALEDSPEGARWVKFSETLIDQLIQALRTDAVQCPYCGERIQIGGDCAIIE